MICFINWACWLSVLLYDNFYWHLLLFLEVACAQGLYLWRNSSSDINDELYKGYRKGNPEKRINEIVAGISLTLWTLSLRAFIFWRVHHAHSYFHTAYDFLDSNMNNFNVSLWYNSTFKNDTGFSAPALIRIPRLVNLVYSPNFSHMLFFRIWWLMYHVSFLGYLMRSLISSLTWCTFGLSCSSPISICVCDHFILYLSLCSLLVVVTRKLSVLQLNLDSWESQAVLRSLAWKINGHVVD